MTDISKGNYAIALAMLALVIVSLFAIARPPIIGNGPNNSVQRTITVNGLGTVETAPDEAILILAVNTQATTAEQAVGENANISSQVIATILSLSSVSPGITKDDIATIDHNLTPVYSQPDKCVTTTNNLPQSPVTCSTTAPQLIGYTVRDAIQVTVKDTTSIGRVLDAATWAGANEIGGISFTFTSSTYASLQKQALQKAIQDASGQAETMAAGLGIHITGGVSVNPAYVYQPCMNSKVNIATGATSTPIQAGTLQVTVNVQVVYAISS